MARRVTVVPHDVSWAPEFTREAARVSEGLGANILEVHHIGSTAIPGIFAKPIIDILAVVEDIEVVDSNSEAMRRAGYEARGENGIPCRRYFHKNDCRGQRTHHVHVFEVGHTAVVRHLAFRDYLRANPDVAREYSDLKRNLAAAHAEDIPAYMAGKDAFIKGVVQIAEGWWPTRRSTPHSGTRR